MNDAIDYLAALTPDLATWILVAVTAGVALVAVIIHRSVLLHEKHKTAGSNASAGEKALIALLAVEAAVNGAVGAFAGKVGGGILGQWLPPLFMGIIFGLMALVALFFLGMSFGRGRGDAGWKVLGTFILLGLGAMCGWLAYIAFVAYDDLNAETLKAYLEAMTWLFAVAGALGATMMAIYANYLPVVSWILIPLDVAWGALGNLLGLMHHAGSWCFFKDHGDPRLDNRKFYAAYNDGFRLKGGFAFTVGAVMTYDPVEKHESQHALQHLLFGSVFTLMYAAWFIIMFIPGIVIGLIVEAADNKPVKNYWQAVQEAVEANIYYNNPFEVWAYQVEGGRNVNGSTRFIWNAAASWIVSVLYYLIAVGGFVLFFIYGAGEYLTPS